METKILEYQNIDVSIFRDIKDSEIGTAIENVASSLSSSSVNMLGESPRPFLCQLFLRLTKICDEIICQYDGNSPAEIVYSRLARTTVRPSYIQYPISWTEEEMRTLGSVVKHGERESISIDLTKFWHEHTDTQGRTNLKSFLWNIYNSYNHEYEEVRVSAKKDIPIIPLLACIAWFSGRSNYISLTE